MNSDPNIEVTCTWNEKEMDNSQFGEITIAIKNIPLGLTDSEQLCVINNAISDMGFKVYEAKKMRRDTLNEGVKEMLDYFQKDCGSPEIKKISQRLNTWKYN